MKSSNMKNYNFKHENINIHCVMDCPDQIYVNNRRNITSSVKFSILVLLEILKYDLDLIDSNQFPFWHNFPLLILTKFKKTKLIITWIEIWDRNYWEKYLGKFGGLIGLFVQKIFILLSKNNITISELTKEMLIKNKVRNGLIKVIPGGVDFELLNKIRMNSKKKNQIISIGRLIPEKKISMIINKIGPFLIKNPEYEYLIIGKGPEYRKLKNLISYLNLNERIFLNEGNYPYNDIMKMLAESKIHISMSSREGLGLVILESLALGVITITNDYENNAGRYLINNEKNGFVAKNDGSNLCEILDQAKIIFDEKKENYYISNGIETAKNFSYESITTELLNFFFNNFNF